MLIKKREEKKLRYSDEWFVSVLILGNLTYYSRDGYSFAKSRNERTSIDQILLNKQKINFTVLTIENKLNGNTLSKNSNMQIVIEVEDSKLFLKAKKQ